MTTATDTDLELIQALDFDPNLACESAERCDATAAWIEFHTCCGHSVMLCGHHKVNIAKWVAEMIRTGYLIRCKVCQKGQQKPQDAVRFEPIGGR